MTKAQKYLKPRPDFPLFPHATGRWAKKVRGRTEYFGRIDEDPRGERALTEWLDQRDLLLAGRQRRVITGALTVADLANKLLTSKRAQCKAGDISLRSVATWYRVCAMVVEEFGAKHAVEDLGPDDFERLMESRLTDKAAITRALLVSLVRSLFTFAYNDEQRLISAPVLFGKAFRKPKLSRWRKREKGEGRVFTADEIRKVIPATRGPMRAMTLLAINCGFGNNDCATLTLKNLDLEGGWHSHPRPKTGVPRRCPLWKETIAAIRDCLKVRRKASDPADSDLVFLTRMGLPYVRLSASAKKNFAAERLDHLTWVNSIGTGMSKILKRLGIKRKGLSFYSFRHTFETVGGGAKDQIAVDAIMGHVTPGMGTTYRDSVDDERLQAVTDHVRAWLFPDDYLRIFQAIANEKETA
jgi:integrase